MGNCVWQPEPVQNCWRYIHWSWEYGTRRRVLRLKKCFNKRRCLSKQQNRLVCPRQSVSVSLATVPLLWKQWISLVNNLNVKSYGYRNKKTQPMSEIPFLMRVRVNFYVLTLTDRVSLLPRLVSCQIVVVGSVKTKKNPTWQRLGT